MRRRVLPDSSNTFNINFTDGCENIQVPGNSGVFHVEKYLSPESIISAAAVTNSK
jgi:hypothetical protein